MTPDPPTSHVVSASTTVAAPADVVFSIVADPHQHPRIDGSGTVRGAIEGPHRLSLGARFAMRMRLGAPYRITSTVVEFEEDRRLAWRHPLGHVWRYELEPVEGGTSVTESFDYSTVGPVHAALLSLAGFPGRNRRGIEQTLVRLAEAAAQDASGGSGSHRP
jgi:uncharacterized protein YndB with AHSA1/START domain